MKQTISSLASAAAISLAAVGLARAEEPKPDLTPLAAEAGVWDAEVTFPGRGGQPDQHARGVQTNRLRSNGMWMLNEFSVDGTPYQGTGVWGWDSATRSYVGVWVDNNEHRVRHDKGVWNAAARRMDWTSEMVQADGKTIPLKFTETWETTERRRFHMVAVSPMTGEEIPLVEIVFTRRPETRPAS
jgi:hypothetical protein